MPDPAPDLNPWPLTIASYNIHAGIGTDRRFAPQRIAQVLREISADIVALQEVPLGDSRRPNMLTALQDATGYRAAEGPTYERADHRYGNAVLSRYPIKLVRSVDLSFGSREPRGALDTDLDCHGHPLRVVATHLGLHPVERRSQVKRLLELFDTDRMAVILLGDLNEWFVWGRPLRWLVSHFEAAPSPPTFPSRLPVFALDRIWIRPRHRMLRVWVHRTRLARLASDHLPVLAHIAG